MITLMLVKKIISGQSGVEILLFTIPSLPTDDDDHNPGK